MVKIATSIENWVIIAKAGGTGFERAHQEIKDSLSSLIKATRKATLEEVRCLIDKHDPNVAMGRDTSPAYWGNTLRAEITQLMEQEGI